MLANQTLAAVEAAALQGADTDFRTHLGASAIGHSCARHVWYHFRWAALETPEPRMVRLWARGDREEAVFVKLLEAAGVEVYTIDATTGKQFRISDFASHFGGSMDGVGKGIKEIPDIWALLEFKTHNDKSFTKLKKEGVRKSKPVHYAQMNVYMGYKGLSHALYCAVNKDTDELYFEIVPFDLPVFEFYKMRAYNVIHSPVPLEKISSTPAWFECKFCEFSDVCHKGATPFRNCRTCKHAVINVAAGTWDCGKHCKTLTKEDQKMACKDYTINPAFKK